MLWELNQCRREQSEHQVTYVPPHRCRQQSPVPNCQCMSLVVHVTSSTLRRVEEYEWVRLIAWGLQRNNNVSWSWETIFLFYPSDSITDSKVKLLWVLEKKRRKVLGFNGVALRKPQWFHAFGNRRQRFECSAAQLHIHTLQFADVAQQTHWPCVSRGMQRNQKQSSTDQGMNRQPLNEPSHH